MHLLDYLAKDYGGAVKDGKVISQSEYSEQLEFAEIVRKNSQTNDKLKANAEFLNGIKELYADISSKKSADTVSKLARQLQQDAIRIAGIEVAPQTWPKLSQGAQLFQTNCTSCHGMNGRGDGAAGASLDPKPANFHDPELVLNSAPYKFYNTIRMGVPGTGMAAYSHLTDEQVWALAFYLKSLPYAEQKDKAEKVPVLSLKDISALTDAELSEKLGGKNDQTLAVIGSIRSQDGKNNNGSGDSFKVVEDHLSESVEAAKANDFSKASESALSAYLQGIEPLEPKMKANIPGSVEQVEVLMSEYRSLLDKRESISALESKKAEIFSKLNEFKVTFASEKMSPKVAFGAAFSIFLREGFEAILIIIVLISILRAMGQVEAIKYVHFGWGIAVAVGVAAWFASGLLLSMSGLSRELLEGAISLLAVAVLVYVGFWLHRYSEMKKWRAFLEQKLKHGLNARSYLVLSVVAFMAVFREAFEVVLFLRAIWIDLDPTGQTTAGMGVLSSFVLLLGLSFLAIKESRKLPLGLLFQVCSWTMIVLAFILAGKGIHSLQEAGLVSVSSVNIPLRFDIVGLYPSSQTLLAQIAVALMFAMLLVVERRSKVTVIKRN